MSIVDTLRDDSLTKLNQMKKDYAEAKTKLDTEFSKAKAALDARYKGAKATLAKKLDDITRVEAAIKELDRKTPRRKSSTKSQRPSRKSKSEGEKPTVCQTDVMQVCVAMLKKKQPLPKEDLAAAVKRHLITQAKLDLKGIALRFNECWRSAAFEVSPEGLVSLAKSSESAETGRQEPAAQTAAY